MCLSKYSSSWKEAFKMGKLSSICVKEQYLLHWKSGIHILECKSFIQRHEHTATKWKIIAANMPIAGTCSISQAVSWKTFSLNCLGRINTNWVNHHSLCFCWQSWGGLLVEVSVRANEHFQQGLLTFPVTKFNSHFTQRCESQRLKFHVSRRTWSY